MVLVDTRAGSKELADPLRQLGLPVELTTLEFGDIAWQGRGSGGVTVDVAVEHKQFEELLQSLRSGRFAGYQLRGMRLAYDFCWLVIEGEWRIDAQSGLLLTKQWVKAKRRKEWLPARPRMTASEFDKHLLTLQLCGGLTGVYYAPKLADSLRVLFNLYRWFTDRDMDAHTSHLVIYHPAPLMPISDARRILSAIPGVGFKGSLAAEKQFGTVRRAVNASLADWSNLCTLDDTGRSRRFGDKMAEKVKKALG